jgi:putative hemolysin
MSSGSTILWAIGLQFLLIFISATFSLAEISLLTINKNKLESLALQGSRKAKHLLALLGEPAKFLATIQVGNTLAGFLGSAFAAENFAGFLTAFLISTGIGISQKTLSTISVVIVILLLSYLSMILSELVPKRFAMKKADTLAMLFAEPVLFVAKIFGPVVLLLTRSTNALLRVFGIDPKSTDGAITEEEIRLMIDLGSAGGAIKHTEKEFLHNVFEFDNKTAGEVMTHRRDALFLFLDESDEEWEKTITENRYSNFPVCGKNQDDITGVLNVRDYLILKDRSRKTVLAGALRPTWFVPVSVKTDRLFRQMKKSRNHFAVTVDEYGSMMGIITMNDLLEELVGELDDDSSVPPERPLIESAGENQWYIKGTASLDKVAHALGIRLPSEKYDTFAGFVFSLLGHIPEDGSSSELEVSELELSEQEVPELEKEKLFIKILEVKEHRLEGTLVRKISPAQLDQ